MSCKYLSCLSRDSQAQRKCSGSSDTKSGTEAAGERLQCKGERKSLHGARPTPMMELEQVQTIQETEDAGDSALILPGGQEAGSRSRQGSRSGG